MNTEQQNSQVDNLKSQTEQNSEAKSSNLVITRSIQIILELAKLLGKGKNKLIKNKIKI